MISKSVIIGAAADDRRTHIIGVYAERIEEKGQKIFRMVSTDGSRLSKVDFVMDPSVTISAASGVLIPKKSLIEAAKFLEMEGSVRIAFKTTTLSSKGSRNHHHSATGGEFPKYADIIVKPSAHHVSMNRQMFLMMLKRMSILSSDEYKGVLFNFNETNSPFLQPTRKSANLRRTCPLNSKANK